MIQLFFKIIVILCDRSFNATIVHLHSTRTIRRPFFTEEAELFAADLSLRSVRSLKEVPFQLLRKEGPIEHYIENQALGCNLMSSAKTTIPEVMFHC